MGWLFDHGIDDAVFFGFVGGHEVVAVGILFYTGEILAGVLGENVIEAIFDTEDAFGADFDIAGLAFHTAHYLVNHNLGVGQGKALSFGAGGEQKRAHTGGHANANGADIGFDVLHGVIDSHT